jgi:hypothetical protein
MLELLGLTAGVLTLVATIPYIFDILHRRAQPERASWLIWLVLGGIALFSQLAEGATNSLWLLVCDTVGVLIIFLLSLRYGTGGLARRDQIALIVAGLGLLLWYFTHNAVIALGLAIVVDAAGTSLTVIKAYQDPGSETLPMWVLVAAAGILSMLSVGAWNIVLLAYPAYIFLANAAVVAAVLIGRRQAAGESHGQLRG